ncbi:hypothetical protein [Streptomyces sp. NPDC058297]|uniref:hypothetical protein n=1 Tax=Streptomyces sp. NPDC058297 TaxID=3346433 RepID=UPI0036E4E3AB
MPVRTMQSRRPVATVRPRLELPQVPYQGLFREAAYEDGQPFAQGEDDEAPDTAT